MCCFLFPFTMIASGLHIESNDENEINLYTFQDKHLSHSESADFEWLSETLFHSPCPGSLEPLVSMHYRETSSIDALLWSPHPLTGSLTNSFQSIKTLHLNMVRHCEDFWAMRGELDSCKIFLCYLVFQWMAGINVLDRMPWKACLNVIYIHIFWKWMTMLALRLDGTNQSRLCLWEASILNLLSLCLLAELYYSGSRYCHANHSLAI